jgi:hypothetical protein
MSVASLNLQRGTHDTPDFKHKMFQGRHVKLCGELLSLHEKLPSFLKKLPSFAENMLVRPRTYIDFVRASQAPAKVVSPTETCQTLIQGAKMSRIKLNLRQAVPDKLQTGRQIVAAMTNNPNFATPHPPLTDVAASLSTLDEAYKAHQVAKADARTKANVADDAEIQLDSHLRKLAAYVESIA